MNTLLGGRYELGALIGRGGMAQVYRANDTVLNRQVAVKVLSSNFSSDPEFVARFRREAQAAARLSHPNVVSVFDTGSDDGTHYIVMEYVEGRTLADVLAQEGRLPPERGARVAESVCKALGFAHEEGIVHRDIKPGNIMITRQGEVKVMDFGIARATTSETLAQTRTVMGTAAYLSPEQARGEQVDQRSDIYSLGVVLYEMLTGRPPFTGDSAVAVAYQHVQENPPPPSSIASAVSAGLDSVVMRALAKDPATRFQTTEEFRSALEGARGGAAPLPAATTAVPAATTQVMQPAMAAGAAPPPPGRGWGWLGWAFLVLLAVGAIGGGAYLLAKGLVGPSTPSPTPGATVPMPDLTGSTRAQALKTITDAHLKLAHVNFGTPPGATPGQVYQQDPSAFQLVKPGTPVTIWIAEQPSPTTPPPPAKVTVPNLATLTQAQAEQAILGASLTVGNVTTEPSATVPSGVVMSQDPPTFTKVKSGTPVNFVVSSGQIALQDFTCMPIPKAENILTGERLVPTVSATPAPDLSCPNSNHVGSQDPAPGTMVDPGSTVTLFPSGP